MNRAIRALIWEQVWKSRAVIPVLIFLLGASAGMVWAILHAEPASWWTSVLARWVGFSFVCSLFLAVAPFTLAESSSGWRMNSMVTRWFVLPVPTIGLVLISLAVVAVALTLLLAAWYPLITALTREKVDFYPFLAVWIVGAAAMQTLAWVVPRRPSQYWPVAAVLFVVVFVASAGTQAWGAWTSHRSEVFEICGLLLLALVAVSYYAAQWNRCGDWAGEISFGKAVNWLFGLRPQFRHPRSPFGAIAGSDVMGSVCVFSIFWALVVALVVGFELWAFFHMANWRWMWARLGWKMLVYVAILYPPFVAVVWLAVGGLYFGGEPGFGFRTRLSSFRATMPVGSGTLAVQRISTPVLCWAVLWAPLLVLACFYQTPDLQITGQPHEIFSVLGRLMAVSAHMAIGALPLFLLGRLEGFTNMLLCAIVVWFAPFFVVTFAGAEEVLTTGAAISLALWLTVKLGVTGWALGKSLRDGIITWRFATGMVAGWLVITGALTWLLPVWSKWGVSGLAGVAVFLPLARVALCPMAISANRHR